MNSQQRRKQRRLEASQAVELNAAACHDSELKWLEASAEGEQKPLKTFSGIAYSGDAMDVGWGPPVVVDLSGMDTSKNVVALMDHDSSQRVGHITAIDVGANRKLKISGKISAAGDAAKTVVADASSGFPWQFSIGATVKRQEFVEAGQKVNVNGRALTGPLIVARQSTLREVSFVAVGADASTSASLAASASKGVREMEFSQWLAAKGIDESTLPEAASTALKASYESDKGARAKPDSVEVKASGEVVASELKSVKDTVTQLQAMIAEQKRVAEINALPNVSNEIKAAAIAGNKTVNDVALEFVRASRPAGPAIHVAQHNVTGKVLEAAACQALGLKASEKHYDTQTLEAAHKEFKNRVSLGDILMQAAWSNGYSGRSLKQDIPGVLRAAFSTNDIGDVLSNTANKFALQTYMAVENSWRAISAVRNVQDFKTVTSYRLTGNLQFAKVGAGGKIENGDLGNQSYTNSADTYAKMLSITRQDIINDDLSVLSAVPGMIGRGAALKQNEVFWTEFMNNSSFFNATHNTAGDTGNSNYQSGSPGSLLSVDGLTAAELLFFNQVDPQGKPLGIMPKILLVPNALNVKASQLTRDTEVRDTTASTKYTTGNPHAGKFNVVRSSYLSNTTITGYSTTAWYLLADPMDLPVIEMCFLNGQEVPVIEQAEADFNTLGIQMRGYNDFGVAKQDFRGGVKSAGA